MDNPVYGTWDELVIEMEVGVAWQCEWGSECDMAVSGCVGGLWACAGVEFV